jgi:lipopolysaccharide export system protein LptA
VAFAGVSLSSPGGETHVSAASARVLEEGQGMAEVVAGTLATEGAPPLEVTAARSTWDLRTRTVVLEGEVVALRGATRMTCEQATVLFDEDQRVSRVDAAGGVRLTQAERTATADTAVLEASAGRITMRGHASLQEGGNRMEGEPIVVFLDDDRVECEGCRLVVDGAGIGAQQ